MRLSVQHLDDMRFRATVGKHAVIADAAPDDGGGGTAMSAPQLFVAAVGACILKFVANSCRLREVAFEQLGVELEYEELELPHRVGPLQVALHIKPEPPDDVKRRLIGVARHATLVNTLGRPPEVSIRFGNN